TRDQFWCGFRRCGITLRRKCSGMEPYGRKLYRNLGYHLGRKYRSHAGVDIDEPHRLESKGQHDIIDDRLDVWQCDRCYYQPALLLWRVVRAKAFYGVVYGKLGRGVKRAVVGVFYGLRHRNISCDTFCKIL